MISFKDELWCEIDKMSPLLSKCLWSRRVSTTLKLCLNHHPSTWLFLSESTGSKSCRPSSCYSFCKISKHPMVWKRHYQFTNHSSVSDTSVNINYVFTKAEGFPSQNCHFVCINIDWALSFLLADGRPEESQIHYHSLTDPKEYCEGQSFYFKNK